MDWAKTVGGSVASSLGAAFEVVPVWTVVVVLLVVGWRPGAPSHRTYRE